MRSPGFWHVIRDSTGLPLGLGDNFYNVHQIPEG